MDERSVGTYTQALMRTPFFNVPGNRIQRKCTFVNPPPFIEKSSIVVN